MQRDLRQLGGSQGGLLAGAVLISFSAVFVRLAAVGPSVAGFYRMAFGGILLLAIVVAGRRRIWHGWQSFGLAALAGFFFAGDLTFWHRSIGYVGPGLATILANFQVFFVTSYAVIVLKERPDWRFWAAIPLAVAGLFLLVGFRWNELGDSYQLGVIFGLITAQFYASFVLTLRKLQSLEHSSSSMASTMISSLTTAAAIGIIALLFGESFRIDEVDTLLWLLLYGFCGQVLGWVLITRSIKHISAARVSLTLLLQPALAFLWDLLFFDRPTTGWEICGALLALVAIYLGTTPPRPGKGD